jgi:hypothetical protein
MTQAALLVQTKPTGILTFVMFSFRHNAANTDNMCTANWKWSHNIYNLLLKKEASTHK